MKTKFEEWAKVHAPGLELEYTGEHYEWLDTETAFNIFKAGAIAGVKNLQSDIEKVFFEEMEKISTGQILPTEGEGAVRQSLKAAIKLIDNEQPK
jgi:hypothetical protein